MQYVTHLYSTHFVFICSLLSIVWFLWYAFTLYHFTVFWPESPTHHCGPADLWWTFHVYIWVNPVQSGGLHHGAVGVLSRGNPLDPHSGSHAESRAWSVLKWQILLLVWRIHIILNFIFMLSLHSGLQNPVDALYHIQPLMFIGLFPLFQYNEGEYYVRVCYPSSSLRVWNIYVTIDLFI